MADLLIQVWAESVFLIDSWGLLVVWDHTQRTMGLGKKWSGKEGTSVLLLCGGAGSVAITAGLEEAMLCSHRAGYKGLPVVPPAHLLSRYSLLLYLPRPPGHEGRLLRTGMNSPHRHHTHSTSPQGPKASAFHCIWHTFPIPMS